jgi:hypothetical protein
MANYSDVQLPVRRTEYVCADQCSASEHVARAVSNSVVNIIEKMLERYLQQLAEGDGNAWSYVGRAAGCCRQ